MCPLIKGFVASLAASLILSCATPRPASLAPPVGGDSLSAPNDSLEIAAYDDIYVEKHMSLVREISEREKRGEPEGRLMEARSLVTASEELYLRGMFDAAIKLLDEASRALRQDH